MRDLKFCKITGAIEVPKARVIWDDGVLHIWGKDGGHTSVLSAEPVRQSARRYTAESDAGPLHLKRGCGCGMPLWIRTRRDGKRMLAKL